jgi:hypothetical protein
MEVQLIEPMRRQLIDQPAHRRHVPEVARHVEVHPTPTEFWTIIDHESWKLDLFEFSKGVRPQRHWRHLAQHRQRVGGARPRARLYGGALAGSNLVVLVAVLKNPQDLNIGFRLFVHDLDPPTNRGTQINGEGLNDLAPIVFNRDS